MKINFSGGCGRWYLQSGGVAAGTYSPGVWLLVLTVIANLAPVFDSILTSYNYLFDDHSAYLESSSCNLHSNVLA